MTQTRTARAALVATVSVVLLTTGCTGSSGGSDGGKPKQTTTTEGAVQTAADGPVPLPGATNVKGSVDISAQGTSPSITVTMYNDYFTPTYIQTAPGAEVTVKVVNKSPKSHTFTTDDDKTDVRVKPGKSATTTVRVPGNGSTRFRCTDDVGMGMQGVFFTTPANAGTSSTTTTP